MPDRYSRYSVEVVGGEQFTTFRIRPPLSLGELVGLPRPRFAGAEGVETDDFTGIWEDCEGASEVAIDSRVFRGGGAFTSAEKYAREVFDHLAAQSQAKPDVAI